MRRTGWPVIKNILEADTEHRLVGWGQLESGRPVTPSWPWSVKWTMMIHPRKELAAGAEVGGPAPTVLCINYKWIPGSGFETLRADVPLQNVAEAAIRCAAGEARDVNGSRSEGSSEESDGAG